MKHLLLATVTVIALGLGAESASLGHELTPPLKKFYGLLQSEIRDDYDHAQRAIETERLRKVKAGELPVASDRIKEGSEGIKIILYNKAVSKTLCYEQTVPSSKKPDEWEQKFKECASAKTAQLGKFIKLMTDHDYVRLLGLKYVKCELKTRDFENESRFPPYDFLQFTDGPKLLDLGLMNECLLEGL
jgi:hypothetical protein